MKVLKKSFFARPAKQVARDLPGKMLVRTVGRKTIRALVVQAEAFDGTDGRPTRKGMEYAPGTVFMMNFRGVHFLNLCTDRAGEASCVMISAILLPQERVEGPGRVSKALQIDDAFSGKVLGDDLMVVETDFSFTSVAKRGNDDRAENSEGIFRLEQRCIDDLLDELWQTA